ncbi:ribonuclease H family protein [Clostridium sp.]|uniref:ribonuclease H family protein n=1 Tax=Clostridium sp. TaxID=1506 RepID=UPI00260387D8|nr:ribonuclease H family protein [Clostridium sp.]
MGKKVYAIKEGYDKKKEVKIKNIIVDTWEECFNCVKGVKGAKYKGFEDIKEAKRYLEEGSKLLKKGEDEYPTDCLQIYVDGSYNSFTEKYAYAFVVLRNNVIEHIQSEGKKHEISSNIRQIAGELEGTVKGLEYAIRKNEKKVVIFHDYEGICHHATGFWERKEESSKSYYNKMQEIFSLGIEVIFVKVDSHTGDLYNELADEKCKERLSIDSSKTISKWLSNNLLYVLNEEVYKELSSLAKGKEKNIINISEENSEVEIEPVEIDEVSLDKENKEITKEINKIVNKSDFETKKKILKMIKAIME